MLPHHGSLKWECNLFGLVRSGYSSSSIYNSLYIWVMSELLKYCCCWFLFCHYNQCMHLNGAKSSHHSAALLLAQRVWFSATDNIILVGISLALQSNVDLIQSMPGIVISGPKCRWKTWNCASRVQWFIPQNEKLKEALKCGNKCRVVKLGNKRWRLKCKQGNTCAWE